MSEENIQTVIDNWKLYCPKRLASCLDEVIRLARLGASIKAECDRWDTEEFHNFSTTNAFDAIWEIVERYKQNSVLK